MRPHRLQERIVQMQATAARLGSYRLTEEHWSFINQAREEAATRTSRSGINALERADLEDALSSWLAEICVADCWQLAPELVDAGFDADTLVSLMAGLPEGTIVDIVSWLAQASAVAELVATIDSGARAISDLVAAVKQYSYRDQAPEQEIDIHEGIESSLQMLSHRFKQGTRLEREFDRGLPKLYLRGGELNQVWTNLIDNALDAAGPSGEIRIRSYRERCRHRRGGC